MPDQSQVKGDIRFPDGAKIQVKESGAGTYTDLGGMIGDISLVINYDENEVQTANVGDLDIQLKNMSVEGSLTLININYDNVNKLGGGLFTNTATAGTSVTSIDNQVIAASAASNLSPYNLDIVETSARALKVSSALVITSVTGATDGALADNDDFSIIDDGGSFSGKSIVFNIAGTTLTTMAQVFTIVYTSVTPVARTTMTAGTSTKVLTPYEFRAVHTDENGLEVGVDLHSTFGTSGGFAFNFKGADSDGVEEMPLTFKGKLNSSLGDGAQLVTIWKDTGAA